jgi:hypothetical protein
MAMIQLWSLPPDQYLTLIGRFIVSMTHAETYFRQLLWKASGIGPELGVILTSNMPMDDTASHLRVLYDKHCDNQLVLEDIEGIIAELASLKDTRNQIAHRQWNNEGRGVILSHRVFAKTANVVKETPYTIEALEQLCVRAHVLSGMILRHLIAKEGAQAIEDIWSQQQYPLPYAAWLGRSVPRASTKDKHRPSTRKPPRQRRSSRD